MPDNGIIILIAGLLVLFGLGALGGFMQRKFVGILEFAIALVLAWAVFALYPDEFFDDVGFLMRYLENFSDGHFYSFNPSDGPVFGISSPVQGLLNGALCSTGLISPERSIRLTAFIGLTAFIYLLFQIMRNVKQKAPEYLVWAVVVFGSSKMLLNVVKAGLETPIHLAIVMGALLAFYLKKDKWLWALLAFSVISKLDAVPFVLIAGMFWIGRHFSSIRNKLWKSGELRLVLGYGLTPVLVWIGVATAIFGSPLPQSAYAKIVFHSHSNPYWFPFFERYATDPFIAPIFWGTAGLSFLAAMLCILHRPLHTERWWEYFLPGLAFLGTLVLYFFYDPGELMMWYYALPDLLLLIQLAFSVHVLLIALKRRLLAQGISLISAIAIAVFIYPDVRDGRSWLQEYTATVEYERSQMGRYLATRVQDHDTLLTWHGLTGRYTKGYVIDMSALNSRMVTQYDRNPALLVQDFKPNFIVHHNSKKLTTIASENKYTLDTIYFDITTYGFPSWHFFRKTTGGEVLQYPIMLKEPNVWSGEYRKYNSVRQISGSHIQLAFRDDGARLIALMCGVEKQLEPLQVNMELYVNDTLSESMVLDLPVRGRVKPNDSWRMHPLRWDFKTALGPGDVGVIHVRSANPAAPVLLVDAAVIQAY